MASQATAQENRVSTDKPLNLPAINHKPPTNDPTPSNEIKVTIPAELGSLVHQVKVDNPHKIVFVVHEIHHNEDALSPEQAKVVDGFQDKVRAIVIELQKQVDIKSLFKDGMDKGIAESKAKEIKYLKEAEAIPDYAFILSNKDAQDKVLSALRNGNQEQQDLANRLGYVIELKELLKHDASFKLAYEGRLELKPAEETSLQKRSLELAYSDANALNTPEWKTLSEQREDYMLQQVVADPKLHQLIVAGHSHDFANNVQKYNQANPNQQIYLIEITPAGQADFVDKLLSK